MNDVLLINDADNVVVALKDIKALSKIVVKGKTIEVSEDIEQGHKIAYQDILLNENIIKYGYAIGHATKNIIAGEHVHTHNVKTNLNDINEYTYKKIAPVLTKPLEERFFQGYVRKNGEVGVRNELFVIPTVGCVNGIAQTIVERFKEEIKNDLSFENIQILKHPYGCSQLGDDHEYTRLILKDASLHPNAGGVLILGLGCENNIVAEFEKSLGEYDKERIRLLVAQDVSDEISAGLSVLHELNTIAKADARERVSLSKLKIGLKCGGSDGFSGISANPLLGWFSDYLISQGGSSVLTEVPEMFGAEEILMGRAVNEEIFLKTVNLINDFKDYFLRYEQPIYENPSPGNKRGGISTLEEKSLGCTQKAGTSEVQDVIGYGQRIQKAGLTLLNSPGNDLVAASALGASGCQIVLFTTGRGTPFGSFVPTMKISSNTNIYVKKPHWIDFNAGGIVEGINKSDILEQFIQYVIDVASGKLVNNEINHFQEIAIFKDGVTL